SNYLLTATAELLTPTHRYYPEATALAARRGPAIATIAGRHAFPSYTITHENLHLGTHHLTTTH
ncbi:hypothetical protein, partial [Streptomyces sudanensis]